MPYSSHLPDTRLLYRNWLVALACGLRAFMGGLNGRQYTLLQSTDQEVEAGLGRLSASTLSNCGDNLQTSIRGETGGEREG